MKFLPIQQTRNYLVLSRREIMDMMKKLDENRDFGAMRMSDCIIAEGIPVILENDPTAIQLSNVKFRNV